MPDTPLRLLVVDDEALARSRLCDLLAGESGVQVVGEAGDGHAALAACDALQPDALLLDIAMPGLDGMAVAQRLQLRERAPLVVFCTAFEEHAATAFDVDAVDFLRKPIRIDRLRMALQRVRQRLQTRPVAADAPAFLIARLRGALRRIPLDEVLYLQADEKYVVAHHRHGEDLLEEPLKALEEAHAARFVRIHRNCLVARAELTGLRRDNEGRHWALLRGDAPPLEVSRRCLPQVRDVLQGSDLR